MRGIQLETLVIDYTLDFTYLGLAWQMPFMGCEILLSIA
jgi:hypothetical protein